MHDTTLNNKTIAKNTLMLYLRMFIIMAASLYTSRIVLKTLGVIDYGIYDVVGGVVAMMALLTNSLTNSIMRYLTFELGKKDEKAQSLVFSTSVNVMVLMSIITIIIGESLGLLFLNFQMNIPNERLSAANWVYQCTLLSFIFNIISVPYNASIVAHEKMKAFAYVSVIEVLLKLAVVYTLYITLFDKLILYAILLLCVSIFMRVIYGHYCIRNFEECKYNFRFDKSLFKQMTEFAGWNFLGQGAFLINNQGINILLNLFFGVAINAARGIATQVNGAIVKFVTNFMMALNPQITKCYACGNLKDMHTLIFRGAKTCFFLTLLFAIPIILETENILKFWLGQIPEYSVIFVRLTVFASLINVVNMTLTTGLHATGKIKKVMIITSIVEFSIFPFSYIAFRQGLSPVSSYYIYIIVYFILMFLRVFLIKNYILLSSKAYFKEVFLKLLLVTIFSMPIPLYLHLSLTPSVFRLIWVSIASSAMIITSIFVFGLTPVERNGLLNFARSKIQIRRDTIQSH